MFNFDKFFNSNIEENEDLFNTLYENENSISPDDDASFIETVKLADCLLDEDYDENAPMSVMSATSCDTEEELQDYAESMMGTIVYDDEGCLKINQYDIYYNSSLRKWRFRSVGAGVYK